MPYIYMLNHKGKYYHHFIYVHFVFWPTKKHGVCWFKMQKHYKSMQKSNISEIQQAFLLGKFNDVCIQNSINSTVGSQQYQCVNLWGKQKEKMLTIIQWIHVSNVSIKRSIESKISSINDVIIVQMKWLTIWLYILYK